MKTKDFFNDEENMKKFLGAKTEEEARKFLESKCGEISDEEFAECKKGLITAIEDSELENASGGRIITNKKNFLEKITPEHVFAGAVTALYIVGGSWLIKKSWE